MKTNILKTVRRRQGRVFTLLYGLLLLPFLSGAQLTADFAADKVAGCSPLSVSFTNKTTGASAAAQYFWDFGNGNTSTLFAPGAIYRAEKTYTVTLTVKDGTKTATKSATITVYKKPVVDFSAVQQKGCAPFAVQFQSNVSAGDGAITNYLWDFGDGTVVQGKDAATPAHTYTFAQKASVSLTVTNSFGCFDVVQKQEVVNVLPPLKAAFSADKRNLCAAGETVSFINTSTGPGVLSYVWDFGDGATSTEKAPRHQYTRSGNFTVKLTVQSSEGCSSVTEAVAFIKVGAFATGISLPAGICAGSTATFRAINTPAADSVVWEMGDGSRYTTSGVVNHVFKKAGKVPVKQTSFWGNCRLTETREVQVADVPGTKGFLTDYQSNCGAPVTVLFRDTTQSAVQWQWEFPQSRSATGREQSYAFTKNGSYTVRLTVTNAAGCKTTASKALNIGKPAVKIRYTHSSGQTGNTGCTGLKMNFEAVSAEEIISYQWSFGDGGTSAEAKPEHSFQKPGIFAVVLRYTTRSGCTDTALYQPVSVYAKPRIDFVGQPTVCGSNPAGFTAISDTTVRQWSWFFGDHATPDTTSKNYIEHKYFSEGVYTVTLIANNQGCSDTVTKKDFIRVQPPFVDLKEVLNTCAGDRTTVSFKQVSFKAETLTWDFGDGNTLSSMQPEVQHTYQNSGVYKVMLTATNGQCVVKDSATAYVLRKQAPQLTTSKVELCGSDSLVATVKGLEQNPYVQARSGGKHYSLLGFEYGDGSRFTGNTLVQTSFGSNFSGVLSHFQNGKEGLRTIVRSEYFGCTDTSVYVPLRFQGPSASIAVQNPVVCYNTPVQFTATSSSTITSWKWDFGDSTETIQTSENTVAYLYTKPGNYTVRLSLTDEKGCQATVQTAAQSVRINGVKAAFRVPDSVVAVRTPVTFTNQSVAGNSAAGSVQYTWWYANDLKSTQQHLTYTYPSIGADTITLIARNTQNQCADTVRAALQIRNLNAMFTYTATYVNSNACPPMLVQFVNTSKNSRKAFWDFGDGSTAEGQNTPEHTYRQAGTYKVVLRTYGAGQQVDSAIEYITVKGPSAQLSADKLFGCLNQKVTLNAVVSNAKNFYWDYGDGTILHTNDTFAVHHYKTAGVYTPALVMSDALGCTAASELPEKIVIDSLSLSIKGVPEHICDSALIPFQPGVVSIATDRMQKTLQYLWTFENGTTDTVAVARSRYTGAGSHWVRLKATTPYGCIQEVKREFTIYKSVKGRVTGSTEICAGGQAQFTASVPEANTSWKWIFHDGETSALPKTPPKEYRDSGLYPVRLVVLHNGCADTTTASLRVHGNPVIRFRKPSESICLGQSVQLGASGGSVYAWSPATDITGANTATPLATPRFTTTYRVVVRSNFGCTSTDSVQVTVHRPFKIDAPRDTFACAGSTVQLQASGAATYQWLDASGTLSQLQVPNPIAAPKVPTVYTVMGQDAARCFTDTARIRVRIEKLPTVNAGPDLDLLTGSEVRLQTKASSDVTTWKWTPADYLSCTNCAQPLAAPRRSMAYVVAVQNKFGCLAMDTLNIKLTCTQDRVFIPNAFTPNGDGLNETFSIKGRGVQVVKSFRIFDRWGGVVFERTNFNLEDHQAAWDGTSKGVQLPTGTYPFVAELQCDTGELFYKKGTVTLIR